MTPDNRICLSVSHKITQIEIDLVDKAHPFEARFPLLDDMLIVQIDAMTPIRMIDFSFCTARQVWIYGDESQANRRRMLFNRLTKELPDALHPSVIWVDLPKGLWRYVPSTKQGGFIE